MLRPARRVLPLALLLLALPAAAQAPDPYTLPELVAALARNPDAPGAVDAVLAELGRNPAAAGLLSAEQRATLRAALQRGLTTGDGSALEMAPALTVSGMGAAVVVVPAVTDAVTGRPAATPVRRQADDGLPGAPRRLVEEPLGIPVADRSLPPEGPPPTGRLAALGLQRGDGGRDPERARRWPDSNRLAAVLNRLSLNGPAPVYAVKVAEERVASPAALIAALQRSGHTVTVLDRRRTANFADLRHDDRSVAAPLWVDTEVPVPGRDRTLKVPATHAEHQVVVRGPVVNAEVAFFMGIEGEAKFRPLLGLEEDWTGGRTMHTYEGPRAAEAVRVAGEVRRAFVEKQAAHPELPYGGYFNLGVCNDSNAFVEWAMTGKTTLYPLTRDLALYQGDGEIDRLSRAMPVDRDRPADLERVLGSLPEADPERLAFAGLRDDVKALLAARGASTRQQDDAQGPPQQGLEDRLPEQKQQRGR